MEFKGTKGKWVKTQGTFETDLIMVSSEFGVICDIRKSLPLNEQQPNALLISKAPEMLEMVKKLMAYMPKKNIRDANMYYEALQLIKEATTI